VAVGDLGVVLAGEEAARKERGFETGRVAFFVVKGGFGCDRVEMDVCDRKSSSWAVYEESLLELLWCSGGRTQICGADTMVRWEAELACPASLLMWGHRQINVPPAGYAYPGISVNWNSVPVITCSSTSQL